MKACLYVAASGLALALAPAVAGAQTVVSRSIAAEPVETVVTQTPTGTIVTRRPVQSEVVPPQPVMPRALVPAIAPAPAVVETVPNTVDAITTRAVVRSAEVRELVTRPVSARREPVKHVRQVAHARKAHKTVRSAALPVRNVVLNPRERHIVYQTIVEREVLPRRPVIVAPQIVQQPVAPPPIVAADEIIAPAIAPRPIGVGTVLPENVPLYAIPENVTLSVPATQSYSYAYLGGRAYLVDPTTGMVVADVTE
jgi:hypothetical protein